MPSSSVRAIPVLEKLKFIYAEGLLPVDVTVIPGSVELAFILFKNFMLQSLLFHSNKILVP